MIELRGVTKTYGGRVAIDGFSLVIADGAFQMLVGPSGSGKSTVLKTINRLVAPTQGQILIDGRANDSEPPEALRRRMGYVIQSIGLFPHWDVASNIATVPRLLGWPDPRIRARVADLLALVRLDPELAARYPHQLSGGQRQRVGIARALAADPPILLMDEPFGALDPVTRGGLQTSLAEIHAATGKTIVFVTHDMAEALRLGTHIAVLDHGRLIQNGTPLDLLERPAGAFVHDFIGRDEIGLHLLAARRVGDHVGPGAAAGTPVAPDVTLKAALTEMIRRRAASLPVAGAGDHPGGTIALSDLIG